MSVISNTISKLTPLGGMAQKSLFVLETFNLSKEEFIPLRNRLRGYDAQKRFVENAYQFGLDAEGTLARIDYLLLMSKHQTKRYGGSIRRGLFFLSRSGLETFDANVLQDIDQIASGLQLQIDTAINRTMKEFGEDSKSVTNSFFAEYNFSPGILDHFITEATALNNFSSKKKIRHLKKNLENFLNNMEDRIRPYIDIIDTQDDDLIESTFNILLPQEFGTNTSETGGLSMLGNKIAGALGIVNKDVRNQIKHQEKMLAADIVSSMIYGYITGVTRGNGYSNLYSNESISLVKEKFKVWQRSNGAVQGQGALTLEQFEISKSGEEERLSSLSLLLDRSRRTIGELNSAIDSQKSTLSDVRTASNEVADDIEDYQEIADITISEINELSGNFLEAVNILNIETLNSIGVNTPDEFINLPDCPSLESAGVSVDNKSVDNLTVSTTKTVQKEIEESLKEKGIEGVAEVQDGLRADLDTIREMLERYELLLSETQIEEGQYSSRVALSQQMLQFADNLADRVDKMQLVISAAGLNGISLEMEEGLDTTISPPAQYQSPRLEVEGADVPVQSDIPQVSDSLLSKIVDVESVINWGSGDDQLSVSKGVSTKREALEEEFRFHKILNMLGDIGVNNDQVRNIYRQNDEHVIDIETEFGRAQILVADYREVYVIRDENFKGPEDLPFYRSPDEVTQHSETIDFLLERADVWKFRMPRDEILNPLGAEKAQHKLRQYVLAPSDELPIQEKHRVAWANKGMKLEFTLAATVVRTGLMPKVKDKNRFEFGPLSNISDVQGATPSKANGALTRNTITRHTDDPDVHSIRTLWAKMVGLEAELRSFENNDHPVTVEGILADCQDIIQKYKFVPSNSTFELLTDTGTKIAGHTGQEIQVALKYAAFHGDGEFVPENILVEDNLEALQVQAGLARLDNQGRLIPTNR